MRDFFLTVFYIDGKSVFLVKAKCCWMGYKITSRNKKSLRIGLACLLFLCIAPLPSFATGQRADSILNLINKDKDDTSKVNHLNVLCITYCSLGKTDSAMKLGNQALALAQQISYPKGVGDAYNGIATAFFSKKDYSGALSNFQKAEKAFEKMGTKGKEKVQAMTASIGYIYEAKGDYTKALDYYNKSLKRARTAGDKKEIATAINNIGNVYNMQGNDAEAMKCYLQALDLKWEIGDKIGIIKSCSNIGMQYKNQGDFTKAKQYYTEALKAAEESRNKGLQASTAINLASLYHDEGNNDIALNYDFSALKLSEEIKSIPMLASANSSIALIYWGKANYSKALEYYNTALSMAEQTGDKANQATILGNIGIVCETQGNFPAALDYEFKSLKLSQELKDTSGITVSNGNIGEIYAKQKNFKEAEKYILQALYLADTIHMMQEVKESDLELSQLFAQEGQWQKALEAYKQYAAASDSLSRETRNRAISRLRAKAESDEQVALQNVNEDKEAQIEMIRSKYHKVVYGLVALVLLAGIFTLWLMLRLQRAKEKKKESDRKAELEKID